MHTRSSCVAGLVCAALGLFADTSWAQQPRVDGDVVTLSCPGATLTVASDINDRGTVVGRCVVAGRIVGFIYAQGEAGGEGAYTTFEFPDAAATEGWGINEHGDVIGQYLPPGDTRVHGFIRSASGEYLTLDFPGEFHVMPEDLNDAGFAVGCVHNSGTMHGWISAGTTLVSVSAAYEMYTSVNESGTLVGWRWPTPAGSSSFVQSGVGRTEIRYPGASNTQAWGLNQYGDVVGWFGPTSGGTGFRLRDGLFATITVTGAAWTRALGINSAGWIVGAYRIAGVTKGFILVPSE